MSSGLVLMISSILLILVAFSVQDIDADCAGAFQPCQNGGNCTGAVNNYTCTCVAGYTGTNCTIDIDGCTNQTCQNGGTCIDAVNDYTCNCAAGFTGKNCSAPTTPTTASKTCGKLSVVIIKPKWKAAYTNKSSSEFKALEQKIIDSIKGLYNDTNKYSNVDVSDLSIEEREGNQVQMSIKVCLIVKKAGEEYIQDVFLKSVNNGMVGMLEVDKESGKFEWIGVEFSDWKAKDEECKKCSDGGAGPIVIEGTCKPKEKAYTCEYVKKTKETKKCLTYCDSSATTKISSLILELGMLLSVSFNIWK